MIGNITVWRAGAAHLALVLACANAAPVRAQTTPVRGNEARNNEATTGDIIVTATKRETYLQSTAGSITAVTADALRAAQVQNITGLQNLTPSLVVGANAGQETPIALRGISSGLQGIGGDSPVAIYLDGIYIGRPQGALFEFADISRIEVLRGPQGTLFGRNNTGGVINITTAAPSHDPSASADVRVGNVGNVTLRATANGPLGDDLAIKIAGVHSENSGYQRFADNGRHANAQSETAFNAGLRWWGGSDLTVDLRADYTKSQLPTFTRFFSTNIPKYGLADCAIDCDRVYADEKAAFESLEGGGTGLTIAYTAPWATLKSITGYRDLKVKQLGDNDATEVRLLRFTQDTRAKQFSQEFTLASEGSGPFQWVAGLYYFNEKSSTEIGLQQFQTDVRSLIIGQLAKINTDSYAAYGNVSYDITDRLTLSAGLRYSIEKKHFNRVGGALVTTLVSTGGIEPIPAYAPQFDLGRTFKYADPRADIQYKLTNDIFLYASASKGDKSGGFSISALNTPDPSFGPEKVTAFEVGVKNWLFARQLRFNLSAFHYKYDGLQVSLTPAPGSRSIYNAAKARIEGLDADFEFVPRALPGLRLSGGVAFLSAKYEDFLIDFSPYGAAGAAGQCAGGILSPTLICDFSGNRLPRAPRFQGTFSASYKFGVGGLSSFEPNIQVKHSSNTFYTPSNDRVAAASGEYTTLDARLTWSREGSPFTIGIWGRNLTDKRYIANAILQNLGASTVTGTPFPNGGVGQFGLVNDPRTYGVEISAKF